MSVLPQGWHEATFADLFDRLQYGLTAKADGAASGTRFLRITDIQDGTVDWDLVPGLVGQHSIDKYLLADGDFVFARSGSVEKAARVVDPPKAVFASYLIRGKPVAPETSDYIADFVRSNEYLGQIADRAAGIGMSNVNAAKLSTITLSLPPAAEQRRIVAKIDSLTGKSKRARYHLDHLPRLVEKYKQAVLAAAFRGELTREWRSRSAPIQPAPDFVSARQTYAREMLGSKVKGRDEKTAHLQIDADLLTEIAAADAAYPLPPGWCWTSIGSVFGVYVGATPSRKEPTYWKGDVAWVSSGEVAFCRITGTHETITVAGLAHTSTRVHPPGTVLVAMIGEGKTRGQAAILDLPACNNQNCAAIRVSEAGYSSEYVYSYLWSVYEETRRLGAGNNQPALNKERVQRLLLPLAPSSEAVEIARVITKAFTWIDRLASEASSARRLIDRLDQTVLAKAFRGELMPQDPADEPASVLLKRIKADRSAAPSVKRSREAR